MLQIRNINGQLMKEVNVTSINQVVNIEKLQGGVYFVRLKFDQTFSAKFIKH